MLKIEALFFLVLLLLSDGNWEKPISYIFAIAGAMAALTGFDLEQKKWSRRGTYIRVLFTFSAVVLYFLTYKGKDFEMFGYNINGAVGLFFVVLFAEIILKLLFKKGTKMAENKVENLDK